MATRTIAYLQSLVRELAKMPDEMEWVEFKCNNKDPERIAKYISGLSNSATLCEKPQAYIVWGIENETHQIIGTEFNYRKERKGAEELEAWLTRLINPKINFRFYEVKMDDETRVVLLEIPCVEKEPTKYGSISYIRVGSNLKLLVDYPEKEAELWRLFDSTPCELRIAKDNISEDEAVRLLDYSKYYDSMELPVPRNRDRVMEDLVNEKFIYRNDAGNWNITNLGALMIAKDLKKFEGLVRKGVRVIWYKNATRLEAVREREFTAGYAFSYEEIIQYIMAIIPQEEIMIDSVRKSVYAFPEIAIRELLANIMTPIVRTKRNKSYGGDFC